MRNKTLLILSFCLSIFFNAQTKEAYPTPKYPQLFKTLGCPIKDSDPEWVKEMYSQKPNFFVITNLYNEYYKKNIFEKTTHTQNYKQFLRMMNSYRYYNEKGEINIPEENEITKQSREKKLNEKGATSWTPLTPLETFEANGQKRSSHVNVYILEQSKSNPNLLYCGTETGAIFKSIDKAENWVEVGATTFDSGTSEAIKIDPNNDNIVYVTLGGRLFKTLNGGQTWTLILSSSWLSDVEVNPNNSNIVFVSGSAGLKRSTDAGATWTTILTDSVTDIEFKSNDPSVVFVAKLNPTVKRYEIWKSTNSGLTFSARTSGWYVPTNGVANWAEGAKIANTLADPNRLYVLLLGNDIDYATDLNYLGVYRSDDAGETWTLPYDGNNDGGPDNNPGGPYSDTHWSMSSFGLTGGSYDQGFYNADIDVSDTDANLFMVGMLNLFKSSNGGVTFKPHGGYVCHSCTPRYRHPDVQSILIQGSEVWISTDGGVDKYGSDFEIIDAKNKGITTSDLWGFDQGWNDDIIVGGRYHNGNMAYYDNYQNGNAIALGGGESATGFVNLGDNKKVYHDDIGGKIIPNALPGTIVGIPSLNKYPKSGNSLNKSEIVSDPRYWNHIYLGKDNQIWKSLNYGGSFDLLATIGTTGNTIRGIEVSRKDPNLMFAVHHLGSSVKLWKSTNAGVSWTEVTIPTTAYQFSISLNEEDELFLSFDAGGTLTTKVYKSTNLGATWTNLTTTTLNGYSIMDTEVQEGTNGGVYIIASRSVFYRNNSMTDWVNISQGIPASFRLLDAKPFYKKGKLRLSGNRGVWERDFYEISLPKAQPMVSSRESFCGREVLQFEDHSILNHTDATWLWDFPGASSVSSTTVRNPKVVYSTPGTYSVSLTVSSAAGTSTKTIPNMIIVNQSDCVPKPNAEKAINFTGSSYLTRNISPAKTVSNFTFTAWIKPQGIQPDYSSIFFAPGITLDFKNAKNELGTHCGGFWWYNSGLIVPKDKWSYIALIYTPTKVTLVLNEKTYVINSNFATQNLDYIDFGIHNKRTDRQYKGMLEEVSLWDRALSLDEIRLNRHLTKVDNTDTSLFAYYQFNTLNNTTIYDVENDNDLTNINNGVLLDSYCPVGPGVSQKLSLTQNNTTTNFNTPKVQINTAGTNFNGDVVVSKLNVHPFFKPSSENGINPEYYIINNYGANRDISDLAQLAFTSVSTGSDYSLNTLKLYQRERNSEQQSDWVSKGSPSSNANSLLTFPSLSVSSVVPANNDAANNTISESSGQFYLMTTAALSSEEQMKKSEEVQVFPNPTNLSTGFGFNNISENSKLHVFDASGKLIYIGSVNNNQMVKAIKNTGVYFYSIETDNKIRTGKIILN